MSKQGIFEYLEGQSVLILGFGREGKSSLEFILKHQNDFQLERLAIADQQAINLDAYTVALEQYPLQLETFTADAYLDRMGEFSLVLKSPGISLRAYTADPIAPGVLQAWPETTISGQIDLFLRFPPSPHVIGITGTKGKSTTSTLITQILKHNGRKTFLAGNIGVPILEQWSDYGSDDVIVVELSSHQLQFVQASPRLAAITNFYPEHLDHYIDYEEYTESKLNILRYQHADSFFVLNRDDQALYERSRALLQGHSVEIAMEDGLVYRGLNPDLMGEHHAVDVAIAVALCTELGLTDEEIREGIKQFTGMPHRCEYIGKHQGIDFYNDSIATIPKATIFAIETIQNVSTLLVGGMDRGIAYDSLIDYLVASELEHVLCMPETGYAIYQAIEARRPGLATMVSDLSEAVDLAFAWTPEGRACLLSPAASSYHLWENFEARGDEFRERVENHKLSV